MTWLMKKTDDWKFNRKYLQYEKAPSDLGF